MRHHPLLITVGLLVVLFLVTNEGQRGFVEKVLGAFFRPPSFDANHRTSYSWSSGVTGRSVGDNLVPAEVKKVA